MKAESLNVVVTGLCAHHISSDMTDGATHGWFSVCVRCSCAVCNAVGGWQLAVGGWRLACAIGYYFFNSLASLSS